jgi:CHASE2 domain-containing sensor protein
MGGKFVAWFVTAAAIAPVCAVCILGPAVFGSIIAGMAGWFGGMSAITTAGLFVVAGIVVYEIFRRRRARRAPMPLADALSPMPLADAPKEEVRDER